MTTNNGRLDAPSGSAAAPQTVGYLTDLPTWIDGHISVTRKLVEKLLIPLVHTHGYVAAERELRGAVYALNRATKVLRSREPSTPSPESQP